MQIRDTNFDTHTGTDTYNDSPTTRFPQEGGCCKGGNRNWGGVPLIENEELIAIVEIL